MSEPLSPVSRRATSIAVLDDRADHALGGLGVVAEEVGRADPLAQGEPDRLGRRLARARPGAARLGPLTLHRGVEAREVDRSPRARSASWVRSSGKP